MAWTDKEIEFIKTKYSSATNKEVKDFFRPYGKKRSTIKEYARRNGIKKDSNLRNNRNGDLSILLDNSPETLYWIGFILADGCIQKCGQLVIILSEKDKLHLEKFATLIKSNVHSIKGSNGYNKDNRVVYRVAVQDKGLISKISKKYDIKHRKTYNPPNLNKLNLTKEELRILLVGFIDGDGYVTKSKGIKLQNHHSWLKFYKQLVKYGINGNIYKQYKYPIMSLGVKEYHKLMKLIIKYKLPILERKWFRD